MFWRPCRCPKRLLLPARREYHSVQFFFSIFVCCFFGLRLFSNTCKSIICKFYSFLFAVSWLSLFSQTYHMRIVLHPVHNNLDFFLQMELLVWPQLILTSFSCSCASNSCTLFRKMNHNATICKQNRNTGAVWFSAYSGIFNVVRKQCYTKLQCKEYRRLFGSSHM